MEPSPPGQARDLTGPRNPAVHAAAWSAGLLCLLVWGYWADFQDVAAAWQGPQYSHGLLIPAAAVLLIWYRRHVDVFSFAPRDQAERWAALVFVGLLIAAGLAFAISATPPAASTGGEAGSLPGRTVSPAGTAAGLLYAAALIWGTAASLWARLRTRQAPPSDAATRASAGMQPAPSAKTRASSSARDSAAAGRDFVAVEAAAASPGGIPWESRFALGLIALGLALRLLFGYFGLDVPGMYTFVPAATGVVWYFAEAGAWRRLLPAAALLFFMFPLPFTVEQAVLGPLQTLAAKSGAYALQTLGLEASTEGGNFIRLGDFRLGVVEQCSGLRMATVLAALVLMYVFLVRIPLWQSIVLTAAAVPIAVAVNFLRITVTGLLYVYAGRELAERVFHDWAGYLMPAAAILLVAGLQWLLDRLFYVDLDPEVPLAERRMPRSQPASKPTSKSASKPSPETASEPTSERASKPASETASQSAPKTPSKPASKPTT
ncbi:MAG: exosortase [Thermogutta sp.]|nr:exosortase [Thermogutta sp.]